MKYIMLLIFVTSQLGFSKMRAPRTHDLRKLTTKITACYEKDKSFKELYIGAIIASQIKTSKSINTSYSLPKENINCAQIKNSLVIEHFVDALDWDLLQTLTSELPLTKKLKDFLTKEEELIEKLYASSHLFMIWKAIKLDDKESALKIYDNWINSAEKYYIEDKGKSRGKYSIYDIQHVNKIIKLLMPEQDYVEKKYEDRIKKIKIYVSNLPDFRKLT